MTRKLVVASAILFTSLATNPASADSFFRGDLQHRPRLIFDGRDTAHIARVVDHVNKNEQPWSAAYDALRDLAENGQVVPHGQSGWASKPDKWAVLYGQETTNGEIARAKAAVAWLYTQGLDPAFRPLPHLPGEATPDGWCRKVAAEALATVEGMYDSWPCTKGMKVIDRGIVAADSLAAHCGAYDFLAALPYNLNLSNADARLGELASDLHFWLWTVHGQHSNHGIRVASGLGIAAIVINRHDKYSVWKPGTWSHRPKKWIEHAEDMLHPTDKGSDLHYQLTTGAYAEGTGYYRYAADLYLPFFFGYDRFLAGGGVPFLASDTVTDGALWGVNLRLPDGRRPVVDNASVGHDPLVGLLLSQAPGGARSEQDQAKLLWDWREAGYAGAKGSRALELLGAFDPKASVVAGASASPWSEPTQFLDAQGEAVLRTGAGPDAAYCLVVAEHGDARTHGGGHSSVANGAFTFYKNDFITLDPGYAGFSRVTETNKGEQRSLVLVDGKAPKPAHKPLGLFNWVSGGCDTQLVAGPRTFANADVKSAEVTTSYEKAQLRRTVALVGDRYLLVEDRCQASQDRAFTSQIQTNAGAAKNHPVNVSGTVAHYTTATKSVPVCVGGVATAPLTLDTQTGFDATGDVAEGHHDALRFTAKGRDVTFLTAIASDGAPTVEAIAATGGVALRIASGGAVDVAISQRGGTVMVPATAGTQAIETDAKLVVVTFANGTARVLEQVGGTHVTVR